MSEYHRLVEEQIPRLRRYARALTRNRDRTDDLVQDTLSRALDKQHLWQPGTNLGAWLFTIMYNQNVNNVRRGARGSAALDIERVSTTLPATTDPSASRKMVELDRALARLPLGQRQVILLVGLEVMSYEDTAGILSIPVGTVRSRLSRGRDHPSPAVGYGRTPRPLGCAAGGLTPAWLRAGPGELSPVTGN